jgi:hypothetical protein
MARKQSTYTVAPPSDSPQFAAWGPTRSSIFAQRKDHEMDEILSRRSPVPMIAIPSEGPTRRVYPEPERE